MEMGFCFENWVLLMGIVKIGLEVIEFYGMKVICFIDLILEFCNMRMLLCYLFKFVMKFIIWIDFYWRIFREIILLFLEFFLLSGNGDYVGYEI